MLHLRMVREKSSLFQEGASYSTVVPRFQISLPLLVVPNLSPQFEPRMLPSHLL